MMDTTKADFLINVEKISKGRDNLRLTIYMMIGGQKIWKYEQGMAFGDTFTVGSVSVPTDQLVKYLVANCTFR